MNDSKISVRYAKAIFKLATEQQILPEIKNDMQFIWDATKDEMFNEFLHSPIISISKKQEVIKTIFSGKIRKETLSLLDIIAKNRREVFLPQVAINYLTFYREYLGIKEVTITTVNSLSQEYKNQITEILKNSFKSKIELKEHTNKDLIGGFILKIDDQEIDASVSTKLNNIKKELTVSNF